jgi:hypothetical protein
MSCCPMFVHCDLSAFRQPSVWKTCWGTAGDILQNHSSPHCACRIIPTSGTASSEQHQAQPNRRDVRLRVAGCFSTRWSSGGGWMYSRALSSTIGRTGTACAWKLHTGWLLSTAAPRSTASQAVALFGCRRGLWHVASLLGAHLQGGDQRGDASVPASGGTRKGGRAAQMVEHVPFLLTWLLPASQREIGHVSCDSAPRVAATGGPHPPCAHPAVHASHAAR